MEIENKTINAYNIFGTLQIDTDAMTNRADDLERFYERFEKELFLHMLSDSEINHILESVKVGMSADELREIILKGCFSAFKSAFINDILQAGKPRVSLNKSVVQ